MALEYSRYEIIPPTLEQLETIASQHGLNLPPDELAFFAEAIAGALPGYRRVGSLPEPIPSVDYPRAPGHRPSRDENPLNAWYWRCEVHGAESGPLAGRRVAVKDNVCVAGVPMQNGSMILEGYVPEFDATVVTRILAAGGTIAGKATCENLCLSGSSITSATGPVLNPHDRTRSAGGSSSGSAALTAAGEVEMAIGGDQGGSIRVPAALCGVVGLKPTYGLVPYTGIFPLEHTVDHAGPMGRSVADVALLLDAIAGPDPLDPRTAAAPSVRPYTAGLGSGVTGLRVGVLDEGFGWPQSADARPDALVREAARRFEKIGAAVDGVSVPMHRDGLPLFVALLNEGMLSGMVRGNGFGMGWQGFYPTSAITYFGRSRRVAADGFSDTAKLHILLGHYLNEQYQGRYYAKAQNLRRTLREQYDAVLATHDVLALPTCAPVALAPKLVDNPTPADVFASGFGHHWNTCPFDLTGHPAITIPCGNVDGLPVGLMLVGRRGEDDVVLRAAAAWEEAFGAA